MREQKVIAQAFIGVVGLGLLVVPILAVSLFGTVSSDYLSIALRLTALEGFTLIIGSIALGAFRPLLLRVINPRSLHRLHVSTGVVGFFFAVGHAIMLLIVGLSGYSRAFLWLGVAVLIAMAVAILTAVRRRRLQSSWRWIHRLNYLVFAAVLVHGFRLGSDFAAAPWLKVWFLVYAAVVVCAFVYRLRGLRTRRPTN